MVPEEIFKKINDYSVVFGSMNINMYKTCKYFYYYKSIFYKSYIFDYNKMNYIKNKIFKYKNESISLDHIMNHCYQIINFNQPMFKYLKPTTRQCP